MTKQIIITSLLMLSLCCEALASRRPKRHNDVPPPDSIASPQLESHSTRSAISFQLPSSESHGFRIALVKPLSLETEVKISDEGLGESDGENVMGLGLYGAEVSPYSLGYIWGGVYQQYRYEKATEKVGSLRLEANATYGFENSIYVFGGLNLAKFLKSDLKKLDPGLGFQAGAGAQFNKNVGITLALVQTNTDGKVQDKFVDIETQAIEFAVNLTF